TLLDLATEAANEQLQQQTPTDAARASSVDPTARILKRRCRKVEAQLRADPALRVTFDSGNAPMSPEPGPPVSVVIAIRTSAGIVSAELHIPRERFDAALFFQTLEQQARRPS